MFLGHIVLQYLLDKLVPHLILKLSIPIIILILGPQLKLLPQFPCFVGNIYL